MTAPAISAPPPSAERPWRLTSVGRYLYAEWDGQSVLYHTGSGDTRWISALARLALEQLEGGPRDFAELNAALRPAVSEEDHGWLEEALRDTLQELLELDLLERA
jgi:PqqD family protein of HPr-rel-A system